MVKPRGPINGTPSVPRVNLTTAYDANSSRTSLMSTIAWTNDLRKYCLCVLIGMGFCVIGCGKQTTTNSAMPVPDEAPSEIHVRKALVRLLKREEYDSAYFQPTIEALESEDRPAQDEFGGMSFGVIYVEAAERRFQFPVNKAVRHLGEFVRSKDGTWNAKVTDMINFAHSRERWRQ